MPIPGTLLELHDSSRFEVRIDGVTYATFAECTLPSLQLETEDVKEGGQNTYIHRLPVRVSVGTVTFRHGITESADLLNWYLQILNGDVENATRQVAVILNDITGAEVVTWGFRDAYPIKWSGPTLKAGDSAIAIEEIELVHHGFEVS